MSNLHPLYDTPYGHNCMYEQRCAPIAMSETELLWLIACHRQSYVLQQWQDGAWQDIRGSSWLPCVLAVRPVTGFGRYFASRFPRRAVSPDFDADGMAFPTAYWQACEDRLGPLYEDPTIRIPWCAFADEFEGRLVHAPKR